MDLMCRICSNVDGNKVHQFEENMFGTREKFNYLECKACKSLQLVNPPADISKYYPENYSNFKPAIHKQSSYLVSLLKKVKAGIIINKQWYNFPGWVLRKLNPEDFVVRLSPAGIKLHSKILDLGAGNGERILRLYERGFKYVSGIDPFIENDLRLTGSVSVLKKNLSDIKEKFDCIMLNHSFEHMPNPKETLVQLNEKLQKNNYVLIRIPVADSYAWHKYKEHWVALDPPRHFFLHTRQSIQYLAKESGFILENVLFDSMEYQFIGSEQLKQGIKLHAPNSYYVSKRASIFNDEDIRRFKRLARKLNRNQKGDAACFYLKKVSDIVNE